MRAGIQYDRSASVVIAPVSGAPGVEVKGLRIAFAVKKKATSNANTLNVKIWNLSPSTRNRIVRRSTVLVLRGGYKGNNARQLPHIGSGMIQRVVHDPQSPEVVTELELRDGGLGLDESVFRKAYPAGTKLQRIVDDVLAVMPDVSRGAMQSAALAQALPGKRAFSGNARVVLDKLSKAFGFEWSVQNGAAQFVDRIGSVGGQVTAVVLSPQSGLIGSPARTNAGCKAKCLMNPAIIPGRFIQTVSRFCPGYFKVLTVEHKGDTHGGDWISTVEAKAIGKWVGPGKKSK